MALLALLVLIFGPLLGLIPIDLMQFIIGTLLILFGLRWLRKAILRASGFIALHDEEKAFAAETDSLRRQSAERRARGLEVGNLRGTVAVIDDDASLRRSVVRRLNAYGFPAIEYASAEALLNRDPEAAIDCLVLDIDLGGMSGIKLQRSLKGAGLNLPVIFITALEDSQLKTEAERAGASLTCESPLLGLCSSFVN